MSLKSLIKRIAFGETGIRARKIRCGLLRGLNFMVDIAYKSQQLLGLDEREIASFIEIYAKKSKYAIDIGANTGWYSLYFASCNNIQQVFSFDCSEEVYDSFEKNFSINNPLFRKR